MEKDLNSRDILDMIPQKILIEYILNYFNYDETLALLKRIFEKIDYEVFLANYFAEKKGIPVNLLLFLKELEKEEILYASVNS
jgi:hypothetical protein